MGTFNKRKWTKFVSSMVAVLVVLTLSLVTGVQSVAAANPNPAPVQFFYVPFPEDQLLSGLQAIESGGPSTAPANPVTTYISIAAVSNNTIIYYDQWENGYDPDIANPINLYSSPGNPGGTQIWGDADPTNGAPPGVAADIINAGTVIILNNVVDVTTPLVIDFDGRDKIAATKSVAVSRSGWAAGSNTLLAGSVEVVDTQYWGTEYLAPVGVNIPDATDFQMFQYTGLYIMAGPGGATVQIDANANGTFETTVPLVEGQGYAVNGGVNVGGQVSSDNPVQVDILTGDIASNYESRDSNLLPVDLWADEYYTPVSSPSGLNATTVWLYNPGASGIIVNYQRRIAGFLTTSPLTVPGGPAGGYLKQVLPDGTGARFSSSAAFYAFSTMDSTSGSSSGGGNQSWDWGFTLVPKSALTAQVLIGLGIGRDPTSPTNPNENGNPVWVTPVGNGNTYETVYVDYDADPTTGPNTDPNGNKYDVAYSLRELERVKVYDPDGDQTGMLLYTLAAGIKLAAAWGQDPLTASPGAPGLDVGNGVPPLPEFDCGKNATLDTDNDGDGFISPGDVLLFTIFINNISRLTISNVLLTDNLPIDTTYVAGSTFFTDAFNVTTQIADDIVGTAFPLDGGGTVLAPPATLPIGGSFEVTFKVTIDAFEDLTEGTTDILNTGSVTADGNTTIFLDLTPIYGRIGDFVWVDTNGNGIQDAGEVGLAGVTVYLYDSADNLIATTTTDASGNYIFTGLTPGDYYVEFVGPAGYSFTQQDQGADDSLDSDANISTGLTPTFSLAGGEANTTIDAGLYQPGSVSDFVWEDTNQNGIQDAGEAGLAGVTVNLYDSADNLITTTTTDASGLYSFTNLDPGDYYVEFVEPVGYSFTPQDQGVDDTVDSDADVTTGQTATFTLTSGEDNTTIDAGLFQPGSIGDFVWVDTNQDGIQDAGEAGLAGVTVNLYDSADNLIATTTTDASGNYVFTDLASGDYYVEFVEPAGYSFTLQDQGADDTLDSDANISTGLTSTFSLASGEVNTTIDAGLYQTGSVSDFVWEDANQNGIQDAGEAGLAGVTVNLYDSADNPIAGTTTDASGNYVFTGLTPGDYYVEFVEPAGYSFTLQDQGADDTLDSDANISTGLTQTFSLASGEVNTTIDAGLYQTGSVSDFVWVDTNQNGIQDAGEPGLAGVTVNLYDSADNLIATTTTDASGNYIFTGLTPGDYYIEFVAPAGYNFTPQDQGADDTTDSDADVTGQTAIFTITSGESDITVDAGLYQPDQPPVVPTVTFWGYITAALLMLILIPVFMSRRNVNYGKKLLE
jgi:uncharacterized repeat protein (TIGR01451 family)